MAGPKLPSVTSPAAARPSVARSRPAVAPVPRVAVASAAPVLDADAWFRGFGDVSARRGGTWIHPGVYVLYLEAMRRKLSSKPGQENNQLFIAEFTVLDVQTEYEAEYTEDRKTLLWAPSNKVGERVTCVQNTTKHHKMALETVKGLFLAIAQNNDDNIHEGDIGPDQWQEMLLDATEEPGTQFAGHRILCWATKTWTKARSPFTPVTFGPYAAPNAAHPADAGAGARDTGEGAEEDDHDHD